MKVNVQNYIYPVLSLAIESGVLKQWLLVNYVTSQQFRKYKKIFFYFFINSLWKICLIIFARFLAQCENNSLAKLVIGRIRFSNIQCIWSDSDVIKVTTLKIRWLQNLSARYYFLSQDLIWMEYFGFSRNFIVLFRTCCFGLTVALVLTDCVADCSKGLKSFSMTKIPPCDRETWNSFVKSSIWMLRRFSKWIRWFGISMRASRKVRIRNSFWSAYFLQSNHEIRTRITC